MPLYLSIRGQRIRSDMCYTAHFPPIAPSIKALGNRLWFSMSRRFAIFKASPVPETFDCPRFSWAWPSSILLASVLVQHRPHARSHSLLPRLPPLHTTRHYNLQIAFSRSLLTDWPDGSLPKIDDGLRRPIGMQFALDMAQT
jgi:hypothetical protein